MKPASLVAIVIRLASIVAVIAFAGRITFCVGKYLQDLSQPVHWDVTGQFFYRVSMVDAFLLILFVGLYAWSLPLGRLIARGLD